VSVNGSVLVRADISDVARQADGPTGVLEPAVGLREEDRVAQAAGAQRERGEDRGEQRGDAGSRRAAPVYCARIVKNQLPLAQALEPPPATKVSRTKASVIFSQMASAPATSRSLSCVATPASSADAVTAGSAKFHEGANVSVASGVQANCPFIVMQTKGSGAPPNEPHVAPAPLRSATVPLVTVMTHRDVGFTSQAPDPPHWKPRSHAPQVPPHPSGPQDRPLWQAADWPRSLYYDEAGNRRALR